jgi:hypothetical protein
MMGAPADTQLEGYYADATNRARRFVASRYVLEECPPASPDYPGQQQSWREVWSVRVAPLDELQNFILAVPHTFPDDLPKVYVPVRVVGEIKQIPHLDAGRLLCTFDEVTAKPNADDPGGVALTVLERAVEVFRDGLSGDNHRDYSEELQAYWALDSDTISLSLIEPDTAATSVVMLHLQPSWRGYSYMFAPTEDAGKRWLKAIGCASKVEAQKVPLLHLQTLGDPPMPSTNGDIYRLLRRQEDGSCLKRLAAHLQRSERPSAVLFSVPTADGERMLGAWWHPKVVHEVNRGPGHQRIHQHVVPGFRAGSNSSAVVAELSVRHQKAKIIRSVVERVDRARLFARTAGATRPALEHPVNMVGCGSLGSITASTLAQSGKVDRLRTIDPEKLQPENVLRHYCGMSDIGEYKAEATSRKLSAHLPHVECEPHTKDVLEMLRTSPALLTPASLTVVTVGDIAVERRLNRLFKADFVFGGAPICFIWVEPHLFAGHALFLRRGQPGCFECAFDEHFHFKRRVLANPSVFSRREAGCQSTFIPYSGVGAVQFVGAATRFLIESLGSSKNRIFTWVGDVEEARRRGIRLEAEWEHTSPFSARTKTLTPNMTCPVCGAND